jgi:hypothetical protein
MRGFPGSPDGISRAKDYEADQSIAIFVTMAKNTKSNGKA